MSTTTTEWNLLERVEERAEFFKEHDPEGESLLKLPDAVAEELRSIGVLRALQPKAYGGLESHPAEFLRAVVQVGRRSGAAGWVAGVVGVHAHELAQADPRLQEELWGENPDTWIASPYAPAGTAIPVEGGFRFSGRWSFSSGTDHCDWVVIGGLVVGPDGQKIANDPHHFVLPRSDYEILHDSWDVMGLRGTGSKDLVVDDVFVPEHRVLSAARVSDNTYADRYGLHQTLYRIPQYLIFRSTIAGGTLAMAQGVADAFVDWVAQRENRRGGSASSVHTLTVYGEAASDIRASITNYFDAVNRVWDIADSGRLPTDLEHYEFKAGWARDVERAVLAADRLYNEAGGSAGHQRHPLNRMWRDLRVAKNHGGNVTEPQYYNFGLAAFGHSVDGVRPTTGP